MKNILVPFNFSPIAENSLNYAVRLAQVTHAKITLFYVYELILSHDFIGLVATAEELEAEFMPKLEAVKSSLLTTYENKIDVDYSCKAGETISAIHSFVAEHEIDLIVVGLRGGGFLTEKLAGSTATDLVRNASVPVLAIGKDVNYKCIKKMLLASDDYEIAGDEAISQLKVFMKSFLPHLYILHVSSEAELVPVTEENKRSSNLGRLLNDVPHSFYFRQEGDIPEAINEFVKEQDIDLLVVVPREHSLIHSVFHESMTKRIAFHAEIPILAIHE